jgi:Icc-related predicted phosphoesterase
MGEEDAFIGEKPVMSADASQWFPGFLLKHGDAVRTLWLMHEPPSGTRLSARGSVVEGNREWRLAIERFSPLLTISGHDHLTPVRSGVWYDHIEKTVCVNVGQIKKQGLRYAVLDFLFRSGAPSLPGKVRIQAFPDEEHFIIAPKQE